MVAASDTTDHERARQRALLAAASPAERLLKALALSAFVRQLAWAGAERSAGGAGPDAVRERFLVQLYGPDLSDDLRALIARL